mgnify:CR=1 FL=1
MNYRIPRRVDLGHGFVLKVVLVPPLRLAELYWDYLDTDPDSKNGTLAGFLDDTDVLHWVIYINSRLPKKEKWDTFYHELLHAVTDIKDIVRGE